MQFDIELLEGIRDLRKTDVSGDELLLVGELSRMDKERMKDDNTQEFTALAVDTVVSHYRIVGRVGAGGMGEVFLAADTSLKREVVLKFLSLQLLGKSDFKARFLREAQAAARLNHPNIIVIHEVSSFHGRPFIAMEYVDGSTLRELLDKERLSLERAIEILIHVCEGLACAHQCGIIHRDLKPANIKIDGNGRVKILDFGLAKADDDAQITREGTALGTIDYMSPEQGEGWDVDTRSDLFSAGVLFYEIITGVCPFKKSNLPATIHAIVHEEPPAIADYRPEAGGALQQFISKAMSKNRDVRYQTANDMIRDLRELLENPGAQLTDGYRASPQRPKVKSLAVLYLRNLGTPDDEFLSYGITEDLIIDLSRLGELRIAPMRSVLAQKDSEAELDDIARKLKVEVVLDGSIHRYENRIRLSAQLIDVARDEDLWSFRWEKPFEDLHQIKQELAGEVSKALSINPSVAEAAQVGILVQHNPQAYEYYLRGKYAFDHKTDKSDVEIALGLYREALQLGPTLLAARWGIAEAHTHKGEYARAADELLSALSDARANDLRADEATILRHLARAFYSQSRWDQAMEYGQQARNLSKEMSDLVGEADALGIMIDILEPQAKYEQALPLFGRVLEINRYLNDEEKAAEALKGMGVIHQRKGEFDSALKLYGQALEIGRKQENLALQAKLLNNIGLVGLRTGDLETALKNFEQAYEIHGRLGDEPAAAVNNNNIGIVHFLRGDFRDALSAFEKSRTVAKLHGDRKNTALATENASKVKIILGEYEEGIVLAGKALSLARELDYRLIIVTALKDLGDALAFREELEAADQHYLEALKVAEGAHLRGEMAMVLCARAALQFAAGRTDRCAVTAEQALRLSEEVGLSETRIRANIYRAACAVTGANAFDGLAELKTCLERAKRERDPRLITLVSRLLGEALTIYGRDDQERGSGHILLREALQLAETHEIAHEARLLTHLVKKSN